MRHHAARRDVTRRYVMMTVAVTDVRAPIDARTVHARTAIDARSVVIARRTDARSVHAVARRIAMAVAHAGAICAAIAVNRRNTHRRHAVIVVMARMGIRAAVVAVLADAVAAPARHRAL